MLSFKAQIRCQVWLLPLWFITIIWNTICQSRGWTNYIANFIYRIFTFLHKMVHIIIFLVKSFIIIWKLPITERIPAINTISPIWTRAKIKNQIKSKLQIPQLKQTFRCILVPSPLVCDILLHTFSKSLVMHVILISKWQVSHKHRTAHVPLIITEIYAASTNLELFLPTCCLSLEIYISLLIHQGAVV
jgi:hypothetical protein